MTNVFTERSEKLLKTILHSKHLETMLMVRSAAVLVKA